MNITRHCAKIYLFHVRRIRYVDYETPCPLIRACHVRMIVTACLPAAHSLHFTVFSVCKTLLLGYSASVQTHAPDLLKQLHWLPVSSRIQFKLLLFTLMFDINHGTASQYLSELVRRCDDTRLRSSVRSNLVVSRTRLHVTDRAFSIAGPRAWNSLSSDIKLISSRASFRKKLKTHLYSLI